MISLHSIGARRLFSIAIPLALLLVLLLPATSKAHAILLRSDPAKDTILNTAPTQVRMWFSEDLNPTFSTATVVDQTNQRADINNAHVSSTREIDLSLRPSLPPAVYIVIWRTQSADDGHVLTGSFIFTVAQPDGTIPKLNGALPGQNALGDKNVSQDLSNGQLDGPVFFNFIMVSLVDLCVVFWVGAQLWYTFVKQEVQNATTEQNIIEQRAERRFERKFALPVLLLLLLANIGVLLSQGLLLTGNLKDIFTPTILGGLISNGHFGTYWTMRTIVVVLAIALAIYRLFYQQQSRRSNNILSWCNLALALALLIAITLSGHAAAVGNNILVYATLADWLHLLAASLWIGAMMYLSVIYLPALRGSAQLEQTRVLLSTIARFSPLAICGVIIMAVTGPFNAAVHMNSFEQLLTTAYGRALVLKVLLVGGLLLTSALHVGLLRPRLIKDYKRWEQGTTLPLEEKKLLESRIVQQSQRLRVILRWEPLLGVAVLLCTGLMNVFAGTLLPPATNQPAPTVQAKPFNTTIKTNDNRFITTLNITPNHFGTNKFTVSVQDSDGKPVTNIGVSLYTTMLDMDMGTDTINLQPDGQGHFTASGDLNMGGNWQIRIQIRTPANTLHEARVKFFTPF